MATFMDELSALRLAVARAEALADQWAHEAASRVMADPMSTDALDSANDLLRRAHALRDALSGKRER